MPIWLQVLVSVCSVSALAGVAWILSRSVPVRVAGEWTRLAAEFDAIRAEWHQGKVEFAALQEQVVQSFERAESKRRSAAATASKAAKGANGAEEGSGDPRADLLRLARSQGFPV